jgi:hypothetical protein
MGKCVASAGPRAERGSRQQPCQRYCLLRDVRPSAVGARRAPRASLLRRQRRNCR